MLSPLGSFAKHLKVNPKARTVDNDIFKLHYRWTFAVLALCTSLVCGIQYFGEHIKCVSPLDGRMGVGVINSYCFFRSTYTVVKHLQGTDGVTRLRPGVGHHVPGEDEVRYHAYYQWVPFLLFLQTLLFFLPHALWRQLDADTLYKMLDVVEGCELVSDDLDAPMHAAKGTGVTRHQRAARVARLCSAFVLRLPYLGRWAPYLVFCETLNLAIVISMIFLNDVFLGGRFLTLGYDLVVSLGNNDNGTNVLEEIFPKSSKCDFPMYGPSGSMQTFDAMCVLAFNQVNEKIFLFVWLWFPVLACATYAGLIWRAMAWCLQGRSARFNAWLFGRVTEHSVKKKTAIILTRYLSYSQYLFLYYLGKNMNKFVFRELLDAVTNKLYSDERYYEDDDLEAGEEEEEERGGGGGGGERNEMSELSEMQNAQIISESS